MVFLNLLARSRLGFGCNIGCQNIGLDTLLLFQFSPCSLCLACLPGRGGRKTFFLPFNPGRFGGFLGSTVGLKQGRFCIGSSAAATVEIVLSRVSYVLVPLVVLSFRRRVRATYCKKPGAASL